jgi:hypothetical protein
MTRTSMMLLLMLAAIGSPASAATFDICVLVDVVTTDSGQTANGITEDKWVGANDTNGYLVKGRGFRVKVRQGSWVETFDSNPETGCFTVNRSSSHGFAIRVYGFATDSAGNHVRIHDAQTDTSEYYPGNTYSKLWTDQTLSATEPNDYVLDGVASDRWTTIAAAAYALYRYHDGNADKTISFGFAEGNCSSSGSINGNSENYIESNQAHLIRIGRCASTSSDAREKMIVTHELGHAMLRLYYGHDGDDLPRSQTFSPPASIPAFSPPQGSSCINVSSYSMNSLEWNSQAFKEAFADFYSAKVWNEKDARGTYTFRGVAYDLEVWDNVNDIHNWGGFTLNFCAYLSAYVTTKGDMLRFLWDFYTLNGCADQPNRRDMFRVYRAVRENHRDGTYDLLYWNYNAALEYAIENSVPSLSACEQTGYNGYADWNGVF